MKKNNVVSFFVWLSIVSCFHTIAAKTHNQITETDNLFSEKDNARYEAIKVILNEYKRPITVLELGAKQSCFSFRIANDYNSTCVMIEGDDNPNQFGEKLLEQCHINSQLNNLVLLKTKLSLPDLEKLADCEHFDVILALDFVNPEDSNAQQIIDAILRLGDNIFIESNQPKNQPFQKNSTLLATNEHLKKQQGKILLSTVCENNQDMMKNLFWFHRNKTGLRCHHFDMESKTSDLDSYRIESTFDHKYLLKKNNGGTIWQQGINLVTFLMLEGAYPTRTQIKQSVLKASKQHLTDFVPWNMIVQGNEIALIDQRDYDWHVHVDKSIQYAFDMIDQKSRNGVLEIFNQYRKRRIRTKK